jgi:hypothetical protein
LKEPRDQGPQLVEVVGSCRIHAVAEIDFRAFGHGLDAKQHNGHVVCESCASLETASSRDDFIRRNPEIHKNQIRGIALRALHRPVLGSRHVDRIAVGL